MRWSVAAGLAALALMMGIGAPLASAAPEVLPRIGPWEISYDEDSCSLMAQFGEGKARTFLKMTRYAPVDKFDLSLFGERMRSDEMRGNARIQFGENPRVEETILFAKAGKLPLGQMMGLRLNGWTYEQGNKDNKARGGKDDGKDKDVAAPAIDPAQEAAVRQLSVSIPGKRAFVLALGAMDKPMAAMRVCIDNLIRHWGFDPKVQHSLTRKAQPATSPGGWVGPDDYPRDALMMGQGGIVNMRLDIDSLGRLSGCRVLFRTNPDKFADLTCGLIRRRGTFMPALDADGQPVASFFVLSATWLTP